MKRAAWVLMVAGCVGLHAASADARVVQDERYAYDLTWNAAVRLIRVDMGFAITERDHEAGFVMFTYNDAGRQSPGSMEIVHATVEGLPGCRVIIQLPQMPSYAETHLATRLARKLHEEYGDPPAPPRAPTPVAHADDNGRDHDGDHPPASPNAPQPPMNTDRPAPTQAELHDREREGARTDHPTTRQ